MTNFAFGGFTHVIFCFSWLIGVFRMLVKVSGIFYFCNNKT